MQPWPPGYTWISSKHKMKIYRLSQAGRVRAGLLLATLAVIALYSARKALGLWGGASAKSSDPSLLGLNLNTTAPAFFLSLIALGCLAAAWYVVVEMLSEVRLDDSGILLCAPGYRLFYRWNEISAIDVLQEPEEDAPATLRVVALPSDAGTGGPGVSLEDADLDIDEEPDDIAVFLSEADLRENRQLRRRKLQARRRHFAAILARATRPDGRALTPWLRLLYPQARRPDRLLLYPTLEDRPALIAEIEQRLGQA
jgi:hypothetical protein